LVDETVARLAKVPDAKAFTRLTSHKNSSGAFVLLPYDVLGFAFGNPFSSQHLALSSSTSDSSSAVSSGDGSSGPEPTTALPPISTPASATTQVPSAGVPLTRVAKAGG
jgi:hypothetical protein